MIKAIIIDDEIDAINTLDLILKRYCPKVDVTAKTNSFKEGIKLILEHQPDLLFLDIEMPQGTGFDLLECIPNRFFEVIFITAHDHYALKAIKHNAIDYIIKPVNIDELMIAVKRVEDKRTTIKGINPNIEKLLENIKLTQSKNISVSTSEGVEYINIDEIIYILADGSYSHLYMTNKQNMVVSKNIMEFELLLTDKDFFRCHKSYLINLNFVKKLITNDNYIELKDGSKVIISRRKKDEFNDLMSHRVLN